MWDSRGLPVQGKWFNDGPLLPVEFVRQSNDGRLTLVLVPSYSTKIRSLWALFSVNTLEEAREALRTREGVSTEDSKEHIAVWSDEDGNVPVLAEIGSWARNLRLSGVAWTALRPRFQGKNDCGPTADEAVEYVRQLRDESRRRAEHYVRMTPRQVDTPYRRRFEAEFGWTPLSTV